MHIMAQALEELRLDHKREPEPAAVELTPIQVEAPPLQQLLALTKTVITELIKPILILVALLNVHRDVQVNTEIIMAAAQLINQVVAQIIITQLTMYYICTAEAVTVAT
jgi:hypothetical protein